MNYKINIDIKTNIAKALERVNQVVKKIENTSINLKAPKVPAIKPPHVEVKVKVPKVDIPKIEDVEVKVKPIKTPKVKPIESTINYKGHIEPPKIKSIKTQKIKYSSILPTPPKIKPIKSNIHYDNSVPLPPRIKDIDKTIRYKNGVVTLPRLKDLEAKVNYTNVIDEPQIKDRTAKVLYKNVVSKIEKVKDSVANIQVIKNIKENIIRTYKASPIPRVKERAINSVINYRAKLENVKRDLSLRAKLTYTNVIKKPIIKALATTIIYSNSIKKPNLKPIKAVIQYANKITKPIIKPITSTIKYIGKIKEPIVKTLSSIIKYKNQVIAPKLQALTQTIRMKYQGLRAFSTTTKEQLIRVRVAGLKSAKDKIASLKEVAIGAGSALTAIALPAISSIKFEKDFVAVKKLFKGTEQELEQFRTQLMSMSMNMPSSVGQLSIMASSGLQSGVETKIIAEYTKLVAKASTAFDMMAEPVGDAFAKIRTQLGYGIEDLTKYADVVNHVADSTASSAKDILNVTQRIAGSAGSINLKIPEVVALASASIQLTGSPEIAGSATVSIINSLKENVKGSIDGLEKEGLQYYINYLKKLKKLDKQAQFTTVTDIFGKGESAELVRKSIKQVQTLELTLDVARAKESLGSLDREFKNVTSTVSARWDIMKNRISIAMIRIGDIILPIISKMLNKINGLMEGFANWIKNHKALVASILKVVAVVGTLLVGIIAFKLTMALLSYAFSGVIVQIGIVLASLGALIIPIVAVGAVIYGLVKYWDEFKQAFNESIGDENLKFLISVFNSVKSAAVATIGYIKSFFSSMNDNVNTEGITIIKDAFVWLGSVIGSTIGFIIDTVRTLYTAINKAIPTETIDNIMTGFDSLYNALVIIIEPIVNVLKWAYNAFIEFFNFEPFSNSGDTLSIIGEIIKTVIEGIGWTIGQIVNVMAFAFKTIGYIIENLMIIVQTIFGVVTELVVSIVDFFASIEIPTIIIETVSAIWNILKSFALWVKEVFVSIFTTAFEPITAFIDKIMNKINSVKASIKGVMESIPSIKLPKLNVKHRIDNGVKSIKNFFGFGDDEKDKKKDDNSPLVKQDSNINIHVTSDNQTTAEVKTPKLLNNVKVKNKSFWD